MREDLTGVTGEITTSGCYGFGPPVDTITTDGTDLPRAQFLRVEAVDFIKLRGVVLTLWTDRPGCDRIPQLNLHPAAARCLAEALNRAAGLAEAIPPEEVRNFGGPQVP